MITLLKGFTGFESIFFFWCVYNFALEMKSVLIIYQRFFSSVSLKWVIAKLLALFLRQTAFWHFPGGPVLKNLPASGDTGSIPGLGGSHMLQSNKAHAAQLLNQVPQCPCSTREAATMRSALTTTSESPRAAVKMPCNQKKKEPNIF